MPRGITSTCWCQFICAMLFCLRWPSQKCQRGEEGEYQGGVETAARIGVELVRPYSPFLLWLRLKNS
ncbi:hypothetical protein M758_UG114200 [Ceratodon purpureus]|nr:hypothetical protein M758_UG114200 [Ceratodon purpureus]